MNAFIPHFKFLHFQLSRGWAPCNLWPLLRVMVEWQVWTKTVADAGAPRVTYMWTSSPRDFTVSQTQHVWNRLQNQHAKGYLSACVNGTRSFSFGHVACTSLSLPCPPVSVIWSLSPFPSHCRHSGRFSSPPAGLLRVNCAGFPVSRCFHTQWMISALTALIFVKHHVHQPT